MTVYFIRSEKQHKKESVYFIHTENGLRGEMAYIRKKTDRQSFIYFHPDEMQTTKKFIDEYVFENEFKLFHNEAVLNV